MFHHFCFFHFNLCSFFNDFFQLFQENVMFHFYFQEMKDLYEQLNQIHTFYIFQFNIRTK